MRLKIENGFVIFQILRPFYFFVLPFLLFLHVNVQSHVCLKAIGLAIASNAPLWVEKSLWEELKRPASIAGANVTPSGGVRLDIESKTTKTSSTSSTSTKSRLAPAAPVFSDPAWALRSASAFQAMSPVDKVYANQNNRCRKEVTLRIGLSGV